MNPNCFDDRAMISDALSSQKFISDGYNTCANEAAATTVKSTLMSLLEEEHSIQHDLFAQMQKRGSFLSGTGLLGLSTNLTDVNSPITASLIAPDLPIVDR